MLKEILLSLITLGIYPIVKKGRKTSLTKKTKKYDNGKLIKDVELQFTTDEEDSEPNG